MKLAEQRAKTAAEQAGWSDQVPKDMSTHGYIFYLKSEDAFIHERDVDLKNPWQWLCCNQNISM